PWCATLATQVVPTNRYSVYWTGCKKDALLILVQTMYADNSKAKARQNQTASTDNKVKLPRRVTEEWIGENY
ncbi:hypothetical protein X801_08203, partial [Opisthorchis viverrini]